MPLLILAAAAFWDGARILATHPGQQSALYGGGYIAILGFLLLCLALAYWFREAPREAGPGFDWRADREVRGAALALVLLAGYAWLIGSLGYLVSTAIFFILCFRILGSYRWVPILASSLAVALGAAYLWAAIGMPMPRGILLPWP